MKFFAFAVLALIATAPAGLADDLNYSPAVEGLVTRVDWQPPWTLPPRFRNHCGYSNGPDVPFCSNHCGVDYQFYYCERHSFGCCRIGHGYCDWRGALRCAP
jgi:hypothetical protein